MRRLPILLLILTAAGLLWMLALEGRGGGPHRQDRGDSPAVARGESAGRSAVGGATTSLGVLEPDATRPRRAALPDTDARGRPLPWDASGGLRTTLRDPQGRTLAGVPVAAGPAWSLAPSEVWAEDRSGADGAVHLRGLPPGRAIQLRPGGGEWVREDVPVAALAPGEVRSLADCTLTPGVVLEGSVRDAADQPVAGAEVRLAWSVGLRALDDARAPTTRTDAEGAFVLDGLRPGQYALEVRAAGHPFERLRPFRIEAQDPARRQRIDLWLRRGLALRGEVLGPDGEPVAGAVVLNWSHAEPLHLHREATLARLEAEGRPVAADGSFQILGLAGKASDQVAATAPGHDLVVRSGVDPSRPLELRLHPAAEVRGRVLLPDRGPAAGAEVVLIQEQEAAATPDGSAPEAPSLHRLQFRARSGEDGAFRFLRIPHGRWTLRAAAQSGSADRSFRLDDGSGPVELRLQPTAPLIVQVVDEAADPLPGVEVELSSGELRRGSSARGLGALGVGSASELRLDRRGETDDQGTARFGGVPEGTWTLRTRAPGRVPAFLVHDRAAAAEERVVLRSPRASVLRVEVVGPSGRPLAGLPIRLERLDFAAADAERTSTHQRTDREGLLLWDELPPGRYGLAPFLRGDPGAAWLDRVGAGTVPPEDAPGAVLVIELAPGERAGELMVVSGLARPVVLVTRLGQPVGQAEVHLNDGHGRPAGGGFGLAFGGGRSAAVRTDGNGEVVLPPRRPGPCTLSGRAASNAPMTWKDVELIAGPQRLELALPTGAVSGRVEDAFGAAADATVSLERLPEGDDPPPRRGSISVSSGGRIQTVRSGPGISTTRSDAHGSYAFRDVAAGRWVVRIAAPGSAPWTGEPFVHDGVAQMDLGAAVLAGSGALAGRVRGLPAPESGMRWLRTLRLRKQGDASFRAFARLVEDGSYRFEDLAPGRYRLVLLVAAEEHQSDWIEVEADTETRHDLDLPPR